MASLIENMAPEYTTDGAKAGNYYMHSKLLYLCKSDCSGLFDESNFEQVYLSDLLRGTANSNLGGEYEGTAYFGAANNIANVHVSLPTFSHKKLTVSETSTDGNTNRYFKIYGVNEANITLLGTVNVGTTETFDISSYKSIRFEPSSTMSKMSYSFK